ncbi:cytidine deaminase [Croceicoccus bisphenolivorans]|uniref:cytidine deaminase n=1 Tax=Croceicoccus bisphenolivorans TaxID=1783232 RepID=UPI0008373D31|nr:cytidine deaminase [Croceicoccus bisphenolivorans]
MTREELIARARAAALKAHAPYSGFHVGCAVESVNGEVVTGANMENACYRLGVCAEQSALTAAQHAFGLAQVARIVVAGGPLVEGAIAGADTVAPCGGCRQAIYEAAALSGRDVEVVCAAATGDAVTVSTIRELLPSAFGPDALG